MPGQERCKVKSKKPKGLKIIRSVSLAMENLSDSDFNLIERLMEDFSDLRNMESEIEETTDDIMIDSGTPRMFVVRVGQVALKIALTYKNDFVAVELVMLIEKVIVS